MRRAHVEVKVDNIEVAVKFYIHLCAAQPILKHSDYANWMIDDPLLNFSVDLHGYGPPGSTHFGIQVGSEEELDQFWEYLNTAGLVSRAQNDLLCGYQIQHK